MSEYLLLVCMKTRKQSRPPSLPRVPRGRALDACSAVGVASASGNAQHWSLLRILLFTSVKTICPSFHFTPRYLFCLDASSLSWREAAFFKVFGRKQILLIIYILKSSRQGSVFPVCHCSWQASLPQVTINHSVSLQWIKWIPFHPWKGLFYSCFYLELSFWKMGKSKNFTYFIRWLWGLSKEL